MSDKIRDTEARITDRYNEQVHRGEGILNTDPALASKLTEFKVVLRDMSVDLRKRKNDVSSENEMLTNDYLLWLTTILNFTVLNFPVSKDYSVK